MYLLERDIDSDNQTKDKLITDSTKSHKDELGGVYEGQPIDRG